jgi:hypothetical protein
VLLGALDLCASTAQSQLYWQFNTCKVGLTSTERMCKDSMLQYSCYEIRISSADEFLYVAGYVLNGYRLYISLSKPVKESSRYRRSMRSIRDVMLWQPAVYEPGPTIDNPMPSNKAFFQVCFKRCR